MVGLFAFSAVAIPLAVAQEDGGSGLQVSPTRTELEAQPGEKKDFTITLKNVTQGKVTAQAFLNDFESDGVSGSPKIISDPNAEASPFTLRNMLTTVENVDLDAGETKEVNHSINVPTDASPGAYFGAIRYAAVPEGQNTGGDGDPQVSLTASVAHLVFVNIPGDIQQQIQIENVEAQVKGEKSSFYEKPTQVMVRIKNLGNGFSQPFGKVTVMRGSSEVSSYDINNTDPRGFVLPQSSRNFTNDIGGISIPGKYKINAGVAYGNGGEVINYESTFWYVPFWVIGVGVAILLLLIGGGYYGYRRMANK